MGSTRLPGKVLMDLEGRPMLEQQLRRLKRCTRIDELVVATTTDSRDDAIVGVAKKEGARWFRGSESDVLGRYAAAARESKADLVVRLTADCPLIDPEIVDSTVEALEAHKEVEYCSNVIRRTYPKGLDSEALWTRVLLILDQTATSKESREHVTWHILHERPDRFITHSVEDGENNSHLRWVVDTAEDMEQMRRIYRALKLGERVPPYRETLEAVKRLTPA